MNNEIMEYMIEKTHDLLKASTACEEVREAAQRWLESDKEEVDTKHYLEVLKENIVTIDELLALASSQKGIEYFGAETAANIKHHGEKIKVQGALYCDCPACAAVEAILKKTNDL